MAQITLTDDEVRAALAEALAEKTRHVFSMFNPEDCFFTVTACGVEVEDVESVTFTGIT